MTRRLPNDWMGRRVRRPRSISAVAIAGVGLLAACEGRPPAAADPLTRAFASADSLKEAGRYADALPRYRALRDSFERVGDTAGLWRAQLWWSEALLRTGRRDSARVALDRQFELSRGDSEREGWTRYVNSLLLHRLGKLDSALTEAETARGIAQDVGDLRLEARALSVMGTVHSLSGRYREAASDAERAVEIERRLAARSGQLAMQLSNLAIEYRHLGRLSDAERLLDEGREMAMGLGLPRIRMLVNGNHANVRASAGDLDGALRLLGEALEAAEELHDPQGVVMANNQIADFYNRAGNRTAGRRHIEQAIAAGASGGIAYARLVSEITLGKIELADGRLDAAHRALTASLALADRGGFGWQRASVRTSLARLAIARGDAAGARRWADAALVIADSLGDPEAQFEARETRAAALEATRGADAATEYLRAIDLLESWRGRLALGDLRMGIAEPRLSAYEGAVRTLLVQGRDADAFNVAERARARLLLELMAERDIKSDALTRRDAVRRSLRERYEASLSVRDPRLRQEAEREVARLTDSLSALESEERARNPLSGTRLVRPANLSEVRAGLLGPRRALLAYFWGDDGVYGWWITRDAVHAARLGDADSLAALSDFLRGAIESPATGQAWLLPAHRAYLKFVAPLAPSPTDEILVIADGPLTYLPLEVLLPTPDGEPWGASQRLLYGPSASVLLSLSKAPARTQWERTMLALGDPGWRRSLAAVVGRTNRAAAGSLPYAAEEARALGEMFRESGADVLVGQEATADRWKSLSPGRYRYLHFATHARVSDRRPEQTTLVLAGDSLDLAAIRALSLDAELVTLSACETALGRRVRGEGIIGLPHAFLSAGARGAVVTLWRIADRSAANFMRDFYAEVHRGHAPVEALLTARRARIRSGGADAHPAHWAAFVLVGGPSP